MSVATLKTNINNKTKIKEAYLKDVRDVATELSNKAEEPISKVLNKTIDALDATEEGIITNNSKNKEIISKASGHVRNEMKKLRSSSSKAIAAITAVATDVYGNLKESDQKYLGKNRYAAFADLTDDTLEKVSSLNNQALKTSNAAISGATDFITNALQSGYIFNSSKNALKGKLFSNTGNINVTNKGATLFSSNLGSLNAHGGSVLNFYSEVGLTQQEGLKQVFNSNPMDDRTKSICAAATLAGIVSIREMESAYGVPPRMLCRCDLIYVNPAWDSVKKDIEDLLSEQRDTWRDTLINSKRRLDGNLYSSVEQQLKVLTGELTPSKFEATKFHTSKMRLLNTEEFNSITKEFKSSYELRYGL